MLVCLFAQKLYIIYFQPEKNIRKLTMNSNAANRSRYGAFNDIFSCHICFGALNFIPIVFTWSLTVIALQGNWAPNLSRLTALHTELHRPTFKYLRNNLLMRRIFVRVKINSYGEFKGIAMAQYTRICLNFNFSWSFECVREIWYLLNSAVLKLICKTANISLPMSWRHYGSNRKCKK